MSDTMENEVKKDAFVLVIQRDLKFTFQDEVQATPKNELVTIMEQLAMSINVQLNSMNIQVKNTVSNMEKKLAIMEKKFGQMEHKFVQIENKFVQMENNFMAIEDKLQSIQDKSSNMENILSSDRLRESLRLGQAFWPFGEAVQVRHPDQPSENDSQLAR